MYLGIRVVAVATILLLVLGLLVMPLLLNGKFNPLFGPRPGERWEPAKNGLNPYYMFNRCYDYAKAILFENFARKKYNVGREAFRVHVGRATILLCWVLYVSFWISMIAISIACVYLALQKLGIT